MAEARKQTKLARSEAARTSKATKVQMRILKRQLKEQIRLILELVEEWPANATSESEGPNIVLHNNGPVTATWIALQPYEVERDGGISFLEPLQLRGAVLPPQGKITNAPGVRLY